MYKFRSIKFYVNYGYPTHTNKYTENEKKLHNTVNYLKTIDNNTKQILLQHGVANVKIINIIFKSSNYDRIQIKLVPAYLKRFVIEISDKDKIEERKNVALEAIKYILENS